MAHAAAHTAARLRAPHTALRVPWGTPPFPPRPPPGAPPEAPARAARYQLLHGALARAGVRVLATAHHADDQLETVLMRLAAGSSALGLGGMRPVRRFGMALGRDAREAGWFGADGLRRWIVRPLLDVSKDRILATCDEYGLHYVVDKTNFQPDLTVRNAIRHMLASTPPGSEEAQSGVPSAPTTLPPDIALRISRIEAAVLDPTLPVALDLTGSRENLRAAARALSRNLADIESRASVFLHHFAVDAPPGTFLLAADKLATSVRDPLVQLGMVLRILRYASPAPWGSPRAQAGRRRESLQRIVARVWGTDADADPSARTPFNAGGAVLWTPLRICTDGRLRHGALAAGERAGWLASRAPPPREARAAFERDVSAAVRRAGGAARVDVLFDNRFEVALRLDAVPPGDAAVRSVREGTGRVVLVLGGRWLWPEVVWRREGREDVVLARLDAPDLVWYEPPPGVKRKDRGVQPRAAQAAPLPWQGAVDFEFIRVLDDA
ncbi:PP-loop family-domain-containing protein [Gloeopeniophorella convolvens]|nr:PP-loop family-domain-containing protein [Gloeopeniophorella convolvens]